MSTLGAYWHIVTLLLRQVGQVLRWTAFQSASLSYEVAQSRIRNAGTMLVIKDVVGAVIGDYSVFGDVEKEVLIMAGISVRVTKARQQP